MEKPLCCGHLGAKTNTDLYHVGLITLLLIVSPWTKGRDEEVVALLYRVTLTKQVSV